MAKKHRIVLPEDERYVQTSLFTPEVGYNPYPTVVRGVQELRRVLYERDGPIGLDLEYYERGGEYFPSIIGIASEDMCGAIPWGEGAFAKEVVDVAMRSNRPLVGHAVVGADKPVLDKACQITTPITLWGDSMLTHFMCNQDLTKSTFKDEDEGDSGSLGFMGLWTAASLVVDVPQWKVCRGNACQLTICPTHDVWGYCAVDAWSGLKIYLANLREMEKMGVKDFVLPDVMELAEICHVMEERGIRVNRELVKKLNAEIKKNKDAIFDHEVIGGDKVFKNFNPNSPAQIQDWFAKRRVHLGKTDKKAIFKQLEKAATELGYSSVRDLRDADGAMPEVTKELLKLFEYKEAGKGLDPWFANKYFGKDGLLHARWIITGASSGRKASSKPNLMNCSKRGWGEQVRRCIVPRDKGMKFLSSDASQLELRVVLYLAGEDTRRADTIFEELVENSGGEYSRAAETNHQKPRDVAKSIVHANSLLETMKVMKSDDLRNPRTKHEIEIGALEVHEDWNYGGGVVAFTGINLAERLFGNRSYESRKRALTLRRMYVERVPAVTNWQRRVLAEIDRTGVSQIPSTGRFLRLYGSPEDNAKIGAALQMQGGGAGYIQGVEIRLKRERDAIPDLQIHDELVYEIPREWSDAEALRFIEPMYEGSRWMPGLKVPGKCKVGENFGEMRPIAI